MDKTLELYRTPRLAKAIGVTLVTIYRWVAAGKIKSQGPSGSECRLEQRMDPAAASAIPLRWSITAALDECGLHQSCGRPRRASPGQGGTQLRLSWRRRCRPCHLKQELAGLKP
jgi:hypothetical protein